jgi:predicted enzyme related to lactoylglutathione lyase
MNQIGKSPMWIFKVDDCRKTVEELREKGVKILNEPSDNPFAINAIIADLYGNAFLLQEPVK